MNQEVKNKGENRVWSESQLTTHTKVSKAHILESKFSKRFLFISSKLFKFADFQELRPFQISTKLAADLPLKRPTQILGRLLVTKRQQASEINWLPNHTFTQQMESNANFIQPKKQK